MDIESLNKNAEQVSELLKLLSAPNRLMILCHLTSSELSVGALCILVGMKSPAMSQQLSKLRSEGLVKTRRDGQTIYYSLADQNVKKLMKFLYKTYCKSNS